MLTAMMVFFLSGAAQAALTFGVIPLEDKQIMEEKFTPLAGYLSKELGEPVTLRVGENYEAIEAALLSGDLAFAYIGPVGAVKVNAQKKTVIPIVKVEEGLALLQILRGGPQGLAPGIGCRPQGQGLCLW